MKICTICKQAKFYNEFHKHKGHSDGYASWCKSCRKTYDQGHKTDEKLRESFRRNYIKRNETPMIRATRLHQYAKRRAQDKGQKFSLSKARIQIALIKGVCERTGIPFSFDIPTNGYKVNPFAPSVDKINPFGLYDDENIQIVCWTYNMGKQQMSQETYDNFILRAADEIMKKRQVL